jgi:hypothetical protein
MVEKHKMIADFEQLTYSPEMLREVWNNQEEQFKGLISAGWTNERVLHLIEYIRKSKYAAELFPGSSMGTLLISKPRHGQLNYQQTLAVSFDNQKNNFIMKYSDWDIIDNQDEWEKSILWKVECNGEELKNKFDEFIMWNTNWR